MKIVGLILACCLMISVFALIFLAFMKDNITGKTIKESNNIKIDLIEAKKSSVAGQFYPNDKEELGSIIKGYLNKAKTKNIENVRALIVPHAGYEYSGMIAALAFANIDENIDKVIIIAGNHNANAIFKGISIGRFSYFETPLGTVNVSNEVNEMLSESKVFSFEKQAFESHVIEVELPFLQKKLSDFEIIPLVTGILTDQQREEAAKIIEKHITDSTLIVVSSDLSHYHPYNEAVMLDQFAIGSIVSKNEDGIEKSEVCGKDAVLILDDIARNNEWNISVLDYKNSGDITGKKDSVVGYSSIAFYGNVNKLKGDNIEVSGAIPNEEKKFLLELSRRTLQEYVKNNTIIEKKDENLLSEELGQKKGCFVTLNNKNELRGCIGHIFPQESLYNCIIENTISAASKDERFEPVKEDELDDIEIEVSILSIPEKIEFENWQEMFSKISDKDGIVLYFEGKQSTFLPQVWEQIPDKSIFFSQLCLKQGSRPDCWQQEGVEIERYKAEVFSEKQ